MSYRDFEDLATRRTSDITLRDKAFNIAKHSKYGGYQRGLSSMVYKFFDKKTSGSGSAIKIENISNKELAEKLHKQSVRKFGKIKGITITNAFLKTLKQSNHKPNKMWIDKASEFYNRSMVYYG